MSIDHAFIAWFVCVAWISLVAVMSSQSLPSAVLLAANKRLLEIRAKHQGERDSRTCIDPGLRTFTEASASQTRPDLEQLPEHLGWDSTPLTMALRTRKAQEIPLEPPKFNVAPTQKTEKRPFPSSERERWVKLYPDIGLAMLRQERAASGRLWLLLRYLDVAGSGVLRVVNITETLTTKNTDVYLCGKRQLRNLLKEGEGVFWTRDKDRVWLRSAGKVAAALNVSQLNGRPVAIPVKHLLGTIGEARAYIYASFHAGRQPTAEERSGQKPIARETLTALTGLTAECQRGYERRVGVRVYQNYVVGEQGGKTAKEERFWKQGGGTFDFIDYRGRQGKLGYEYIAWQLPNSYRTALTHRPKGRQKRINRMLSDLFMKGMTGNSQQSIEKRYFGDGAGAARAMTKKNRDRDEVFWLQSSRQDSSLRLWHTLHPDKV